MFLCFPGSETVLSVGCCNTIRSQKFDEKNPFLFPRQVQANECRVLTKFKLPLGLKCRRFSQDHEEFVHSSVAGSDRISGKKMKSLKAENTLLHTLKAR